MSDQPIRETEVYALACDVASRVHRVVRGRDAFDRDVMDKPLVRAIDSVGTNLVEGDGRKSAPDSLRFFRDAAQAPARLATG